MVLLLLLEAKLPPALVWWFSGGTVAVLGGNLPTSTWGDPGTFSDGLDPPGGPGRITTITVLILL